MNKHKSIVMLGATLFASAGLLLPYALDVRPVLAEVKVVRQAVQCVRFVKNEKREYDKKYTRRNPKGEYWVPAKDLWDLVGDKGDEPRVGSIMVLDSWPGNSAGHVAIVTGVNGNEISVRHSNWPVGKGPSGMVFVRNGNQVQGKGGAKKYPLRGFVYSPN